MEILWFLLIGLIAGFLADILVKGVGFGLIGDMIVGMVGALIGGFIFRAFGFTTYGLLGDIVMATIGAVILLILIKAFRKTA